MVWDIIMHLADFDFAYLVQAFMGNLLWVFIFFCIGIIFFEGKKPLRAFLHVALAPMLVFSLLPFIGWADVGGEFLAAYYIIELAVLKFAESTKFFSDRLVWAEEAVFFGSVIVFNLFFH